MREPDMPYSADDAIRTRREAGGTERSDDAKEMASQYGDRMKEKASEVGQQVQDRADQGLDKAAEGMDSAAMKLRQKASQQGGKTAEIGTKVADKLEETSDYLEQHDTSEILDDVEKYVREHPMQAVGAAVIGGFVLARILR